MDDYRFYGSIEGQAISIYNSNTDIYQERMSTNSKMHTPKYQAVMTQPSIVIKRSVRELSSKSSNSSPKSLHEVATHAQCASQTTNHVGRNNYQQLCRQYSISKAREMELQTLSSRVDSQNREYILLLEKLRKLSSGSEQRKLHTSEETNNSRVSPVLQDIRQSDCIADDLLQTIEREKRVFQDRCRAEQETICQLQNQNKNTEMRLQAKRKQILEASQQFWDKRSELEKLRYLQNIQETLKTKIQKLASLKSQTLSLANRRKGSNGKHRQMNQPQSASQYPIISPPASPRQQRQSSTMIFQCKKSKLLQKISGIRQQQQKKYIQYIRQINSKYSPEVLQQVYYGRLRQKISSKKELQDFLKKRQHEYKDIEAEKQGLELCHPEIIRNIEYLKTDLMKMRIAFPNNLHSELQRHKMLLQIRQEQVEDLEKQLENQKKQTKELLSCLNQAQQDIKITKEKTSTNRRQEHSNSQKSLAFYKQKSAVIEMQLNTMLPPSLIDGLRSKIEKQRGKLREYKKLVEENQIMKEQIELKKEQLEKDQWEQCFRIKEFQTALKKMKDMIQILEEDTKEKRRLNGQQQNRLDCLAKQQSLRSSMDSQKKSGGCQNNEDSKNRCRVPKTKTDRKLDDQPDENQEKWMKYIKQSGKRNHKSINHKNLKNQMKQFNSMMERSVEPSYVQKPKNQHKWFRWTVILTVLGLVILLIYG